MKKAILFHPAGDFVTDFERETTEEIWNEINEMGSRWIFYSLPFVATDKTIIDTPEGMEYFKGKRIKTLVKFFKDEWQNRADEICQFLNESLPLSFVYGLPEILETA